jgi:hypothetical protein
MWITIALCALAGSVLALCAYLWGYSEGQDEGRAMWREVLEELRDT